ncbi:hypothetical protein ACWD6I_07310 [Streptomyces sp. NPDC002454]
MQLSQVGTEPSDLPHVVPDVLDEPVHGAGEVVDAMSYGGQLVVVRQGLPSLSKERAATSVRQ